MTKTPIKRWSVIIGTCALAGCSVWLNGLWNSEIKSWRQEFCGTDATESFRSPGGHHLALLRDRTSYNGGWTIRVAETNSANNHSQIVFVADGHPTVGWLDEQNLSITLNGPVVPSKSEHFVGPISIKYFAGRNLEEPAFKQKQDAFESRTRDGLARHIETFVGNEEGDQRALDAMMSRTWHNYDLFSAWRRANAEFSAQ